MARARAEKGMASAVTDTDAREKALASAMEQIQKTFGKGSIMKMGDSDARLNIDAISTGSLSLDIATGIGGVPCGRIVEIYGPESSGKTTLTLHVIAEVQKSGGRAAFIDAEHALDPEYAKNLGVNIDELLVSQPDYGEQALEIAEMLARSGAIDCIVIDSVAALVPKSEIDGAMGDATVGMQARLMSKALRKLAGVAHKTRTTLVFINQLREKIGVVYGNPETTTGGRALKFFSSMRIEVRKIEVIKSGDRMLGNRTKAKIVKNKVAPPFKTAEFEIIYGEGISKTADILECAVNNGVIEKAGSWYSYGGVRIGQGRENVKEYLEENPAVAEEIEGKVMSLVQPGKRSEEEIPEEEDAFPGMTIDEDGVIVEHGVE